MAEAAGRRPLIAERSGFDLESVPVRLVVDIVALGQGFCCHCFSFHCLCTATNVPVQAREAWESLNNAGYVGSTGGCSTCCVSVARHCQHVPAHSTAFMWCRCVRLIRS
jgi:hypothetical protein